MLLQFILPVRVLFGFFFFFTFLNVATRKFPFPYVFTYMVQTCGWQYISTDRAAPGCGTPAFFAALKVALLL